MTWLGDNVADTAGIKEKTTFNTPPRRFTTLPRSPPRSPPPDEGAVLYCTITLRLAEEFANSGWRSGEILELSAKAVPTASSTSQQTAQRESCLMCLRKKRGDMAALKASWLPYGPGA